MVPDPIYPVLIYMEWNLLSVRDVGL